MLSAFREAPGDHVRAANRAGLDKRTAKRAWLQGWPGAGKRAISETIAEEQVAARVAAAQSAHLTAEWSAQQAAGEATAARTSLGRAAALLHMARRLEAYGLRLVETLENSAIVGVPPEQAMTLLNAFSRFVARSVELAGAAIELERVRTGAPDRQQIDLRVTTQRAEFDPQQAARDGELLREALSRAVSGAQPALAASPAEAQR